MSIRDYHQYSFMFPVQLLFIFFSILCSIFLLRLFLHRSGLIYVVRKFADWFDDRFHVHQHLKVPEFNDSTHQENQFYRRVSLYVSSLASLEDSDFTNLFSGKKPNEIVLSLDDDQVIHDVFLGARVSWFNTVQRDSANQLVTRSFVLKIRRKDKRRVLKPYLQQIHAVSDDIEQRRKELNIHSNCGGRWKSVPFNHPASFDSMVMESDLKSKIRYDLETFLKSKQYYHKIGRVWRRSYLIYGPSGTGKSSFIAAVANLLSYDVFNVNLSQVRDDADLNMLLLQTTCKSLIVIEHLDRYILEKSANSKVSSSGFLNFMDGISNFKDERIMIFTMNSKEGIDSNLLRPGRIDVCIHFTMCDFNSLRDLACNYLGVKEHKLFPQLEEIFQSGATMSPAEIGELMLANRNSPSRALKSVITALKSASSPAELTYASEKGSGAAHWKETVPKEFRKLYGLLRMKSCKNSGSFDHDTDIIER
ncbi:AAA-ATPase At2g46620-like [Primulina huaijiensis]|uniref:AAA-ATPase At2g46620-like n=1 Tax=Primulina huaijiensis TaxID=1492673 RepID=UPI003CC76C37